MLGFQWSLINSRAAILEKKEDYRHTSFYCTSLYCALLRLYFFFFFFFFTNWRFVTALGQGNLFIFPTECAHFMPLGHMLVILTVFQAFPLLYLSWWPEIFDVTVVIVWGCHKPHPYKMANLTNKCCVCSGCSTNWLLLYLSPCPWPFLFPEIQQYWN